MKMALEMADKKGADIVMASDPDADRLGIAVRDNEGKMVQLNGNQTGSILTYYILTRWKELGKLDSTKYIAKTIVTTELIAEIGRSFGVKCYDVLTGFKYIEEIVRENEGKGEFICGGEESYGFNVGEFVRDKDAPVACIMVAECAAWAADQGLTLYQLLQRIYSEYGYRKESLVSLVRKGKTGAEEIQKIMADLRQNPPAEIVARRSSRSSTTTSRRRPDFRSRTYSSSSTRPATSSLSVLPEPSRRSSSTSEPRGRTLMQNLRLLRLSSSVRRLFWR